jgi:hypothetical protein
MSFEEMLVVCGLICGGMREKRSIFAIVMLFYGRGSAAGEGKSRGKVMIGIVLYRSDRDVIGFM